MRHVAARFAPFIPPWLFALVVRIEGDCACAFRVVDGCQLLASRVVAYPLWRFFPAYVQLPSAE